MVISKPTPQTTHNITAVRGSRSAPASTLKSPVEIHGYQFTLTAIAASFCPTVCPCRCTCCPCPGHWPIIPNSNAKLSTALSPTPTQIGQCEFCFNHRAPANPATTAPISGSNGIKYETLTANKDSIDLRSVGCASAHHPHPFNSLQASASRLFLLRNSKTTSPSASHASAPPQ